MPSHAITPARNDQQRTEANRLIRNLIPNMDPNGHYVPTNDEAHTLASLGLPAETFIIEHQKHVIAAALIQPFPAYLNHPALHDYAKTIRLFSHCAVARTHQGQGIGTALADAIEHWHTTTGGTDLYGNCEDHPDGTNPGARFWETRGYTITPADQPLILPTGHPWLTAGRTGIIFHRHTTPTTKN